MMIVRMLAAGLGRAGALGGQRAFSTRFGFVEHIRGMPLGKKLAHALLGASIAGIAADLHSHFFSKKKA